MPTLIFTLKDYLTGLKQFQSANRLESTVPTMEELAQACGMKLTPFSRMINNRTDSISRTKIALIIAKLHQHGFYPIFEQLFRYCE